MGSISDVFQVEYMPDEKKIKINLPEKVWRNIDTVTLTRQFQEEVVIEKQEENGGDINMKYRKKPVVIEAIQFNGRNSADIHEFCGDKVREPVGKDYLEIETLEGIHIVSPGDYIIKGIKGEFYPCKPDIFEMTYEPVGDAMKKK